MKVSFSLAFLKFDCVLSFVIHHRKQVLFNRISVLTVNLQYDGHCLNWLFVTQFKPKLL